MYVRGVHTLQYVCRFSTAMMAATHATHPTTYSIFFHMVILFTSNDSFICLP